MIKIVLVDLEVIGSILAECSSVTVANAVSKGILNTSTMVVNLNDNVKLETYHKLPDLALKLVRHDGFVTGYKGDGFYFESKPHRDGSNKKSRDFEVEQFIPSEAWIERKRLASIRSACLQEMESYCQRMLAKSRMFVDDAGLAMAMASAINDPSKAHLLDLWSNITDRSPEEARREMKMLMDSYECDVIKVHAVWTMIVEKVNGISDVRTLKSLLRDFEDEMFFGYGRKL